MGETDLTSKTVFTGFMAAWFLAASPMRRSSSVKETNEGVVKLPCSLAMISTLVPSYVATQEYVVPAPIVSQQRRSRGSWLHTQVDANGTVVDFRRHFEEGFCNREKEKRR